ncbi:SDR family oxidoreductase [Sphingorhabdus sp. SMR4y]|uniref:SDR family oxidoreductase n=1 Tax=Sphingorhabdus sp. SMR4y TaxID=2584094 RepID=UPI000B5C8D56|nr:SDR family oxidoreductase [Sphingorhabdus sp. SMR4y]ASK89451.1 1,6-dihydroxycyclohexa-2,4-diene-1-carboxylate dehydrogenase [Sphingorhabdus sp. SMR4y]
MTDQVRKPSLNRRQLLGATAATGFALTAGPASAAAGESKPDLTGKSILITGCSSGFGYLGALHYAERGAKVFATMRNLPRAEGDALAKAASDQDLDITILELDVLSDGSVSKAVAEAERRNGGALDVVINNAGIGTGAPVELQDMEMMQLLFDTNVMGYQRVARAALPKMRAQKSGLVVNVSSQLGRVMVPGMGLYSSTKFAVESMSEQMAYELVPHGIDVTIVQPGGFPTKIWENGNQYTAPMLERADDERKAAYQALVDGALRNSGGSTDPVDVPRAIADVIAKAPGKRPLRLPVHPGGKPQLAINQVSAQTQVAMLGNSPFGPWVKDVNERS